VIRIDKPSLRVFDTVGNGKSTHLPLYSTKHQETLSYATSQ
jgi:hypothetical protein